MVVFVDGDVPCRVEGRRSVKSWLRAVAEHHGCTLGDLSIVSCSDEELLTYNRKYLDHNTYTDIITFDHSEATPSQETSDFLRPGMKTLKSGCCVSRRASARDGSRGLAPGGTQGQDRRRRPGHARGRGPRFGHVPRGTSQLKNILTTFASMIQTYDVIVVGAATPAMKPPQLPRTLGPPPCSSP